MRPAKDILFDFIRSRRDTGWPVSLLTIYNKYSTYSKIDSSKIISEITIVQELEEKDIQISDDAIDLELNKTNENKKDRIQTKLELITNMLTRNKQEVNKNKQDIAKKEHDSKYYLNILLVGKLDESLYWLAAALPIKNLVIFLDIRDISPNFTYVVSELQKRNIPIKVIYKTDNLLDIDEYDLVIQGPSKTPVKVLTDEVISLY